MFLPAIQIIYPIEKIYKKLTESLPLENCKDLRNISWERLKHDASLHQFAFAFQTVTYILSSKRQIQVVRPETPSYPPPSPCARGAAWEGRVHSQLPAPLGQSAQGILCPAQSCGPAAYRTFTAVQASPLHIAPKMPAATYHPHLEKQ